MAYSIAVASGKGGTGKTTVAVSLFQLLFRELDGSVQLIDCDVEEPNDGLFFPEKQQAGHAVISKKLPVIDKEKCTYCRRCADYCEFNAIVVLPTAHFAEISADLCHSCGACLVACNDNAISEIPEPIGEVTRFTTGNGAMLVEGKLKIGSSMQTMLIRELKAGVSAATAVNIYDAPPGTSCPVVETIADADFVVLVTEPTPFGLHDLKLTVAILREMNKPFGVVINKAGLGNREIYGYLKSVNAPILGEIPFSKAFAQQYSKGTILNDIPAEVREQMESITAEVMKYIAA
jgi:MinD superfamily P-loop ATPase